MAQAAASADGVVPPGGAGTPLQLLTPSPEPDVWAAASRAEFGSMAARATVAAGCVETPPDVRMQRPLGHGVSRRCAVVPCSPSEALGCEQVCVHALAQATHACNCQSYNGEHHLTMRFSILRQTHPAVVRSTFPEAGKAMLEGMAARASHAASLAAPSLPRMSAASFASGRSDPANWQRTRTSGQVLPPHYFRLLLHHPKW